MNEPPLLNDPFTDGAVEIDQRRLESEEEDERMWKGEGCGCIKERVW
jgi:hypothetical protein